VFGADYRFWDFTIGAERETHDATISPFNANRYFGRYLKRLSIDTTLLVNATFAQIDYLDEDNHADLLTVSGDLQYRVTRELFLTGGIVWRDEHDDLRGKTLGLEERGEVQWRHRQTTVFATVRNSSLDTDFQDSNFQFIEVGIRREF
jgi:hypothetical protein